jgi:hypothetical protein
MSVQDEINKRIAEEIANDPDGVGYEGKTDEEVTVLLNTPVQKERIVIDSSPAPINRVLSGLAFAPNVVEAKDVVSAKAVQLEIKDGKSSAVIGG